jgi:MSHA biogenesis protein MshI
MLTIFARAAKSGGQTGIHRTGSGTAAAQVVDAPPGERPVLAHCHFEPASDHDAAIRAVRRIPNRKLPAVSVLPSERYSMLLVEAPDVPADELRAAVRWRIKDLIDFHIDDAVLDVFQMPRRGRGGPNQMMYAIAARADGVRAEIEAAEEAGVRLAAIDIPELCLRNLALLLDRDERGLALLYLAETSGVLLIVRQRTLYLARRLETGVRTLADANGLRTELVAGLALEARRSLDYFESHYEQSALSVLYSAGLGPADLDQMSGELGISVRNIELGTLFESGIHFDDDLARRCMPAIGAALRHDELAL